MVKPAGIPQTPSLVKTYASLQTASSSPSSAIPGEKTQVANIKQPIGGPNDIPVNGLPAETQFKVQQARGTAQPSAEKATVNKPPGNDTKDPNAPVPLAKVAEKFDTTQNGQPVNPAVLAKAAGEDGILTQAEAKQLPDVLCKNKETGEVLPIAECMQKNGVGAIDLGGGAGAPDEKTPQQGGNGNNNNNNNNSLVNTTLDALRDLDAPPELIAAYEEQYKLLGLA